MEDVKNNEDLEQKTSSDVDVNKDAANEKIDSKSEKSENTGTSNSGKGNKKFQRSFDQKRRRQANRQKPKFEERVVKISRVCKTTKGGRTLRFNAVVVVGNHRGKVGFGTGKALEVPNAVKKAIKNAEANIFDVKINKHGSIYHDIIGHHGAARVLLKSAPSGIGIIAGGAIRAVMELAGFTDVYTKNLGCNTSINMIRATVDGLKKQHTPQEIAELRDIKLSD